MPHVLRDLLINVVLTVPLVGAYTMFALGLVFIYRASKVLNLAHGAMAMLPAYIAYALASTFGAIGATLVALLAGGLLGVVVEIVVVRRLRSASATSQTVGTVGVLGLLIALAARQWGTTPVQGVSLFPRHTFRVGNALLQLGDIGTLVVALIAAAVFIALFRFTDLGLAMRCAADNRRAARLMGIDPDRTTSMAWCFAGLLAALGGIMLGASTNLHPYTLSLQVLPAFVAALIGGLESIGGAVVGAVVVGLTLGLVPSFGQIGKQVGAPQLALAALAFVVMSLRGNRFSVADMAGA
ncbi:MAG: branched-chain amino acid transporter permease protein [Acidimicrobiales bacterium]|jgi:branched-chain amino acid transport system permease protein|nr:branched-chain amino acid transporter permease protein [Acidimicrobiales bacterium]